MRKRPDETPHARGRQDRRLGGRDVASNSIHPLPLALRGLIEARRVNRLRRRVSIHEFAGKAARNLERRRFLRIGVAARRQCARAETPNASHAANLPAPLFAEGEARFSAPPCRKSTRAKQAKRRRHKPHPDSIPPHQKIAMRNLSPPCDAGRGREWGGAMGRGVSKIKAACDPTPDPSPLRGEGNLCRGRTNTCSLSAFWRFAMAPRRRSWFQRRRPSTGRPRARNNRC